MAILVSKQSHCLNDLLWRWKMGELPVDIPFVASNHNDLRETVEMLGLPFHHLPVTTETKPRQEVEIQRLLRESRTDFVVLARYMQILSKDFTDAWPERIINIHHSFLPAFAGAKPYHQAYDRGVKIIGATSHYVTADLDQGPIIAQATTPVGHRDTVDDLVRKGRDLERIVLASAVRLHVADKILVSRNKTVVFD
jgi:formyltetrahydrofolate deformylase